MMIEPEPTEVMPTMNPAMAPRRIVGSGLGTTSGRDILVAPSPSGSRFCHIWNSARATRDRKSTRLNSSHGYISYAVFCLKKKNIKQRIRCDSGSANSHILTTVRACRVDRAARYYDWRHCSIRSTVDHNIN